MQVNKEIKINNGHYYKPEIMAAKDFAEIIFPPCLLAVAGPFDCPSAILSIYIATAFSQSTHSGQQQSRQEHVTQCHMTAETGEGRLR